MCGIKNRYASDIDFHHPVTVNVCRNLQGV